MSITLVEFEEKKYTIAGVEFKLKKPTLGIKRKATFFATGVYNRMQELLLLVNKSEKIAKAKTEDADLLKKTYEDVEYLQTKFNEIFIKAEEFFRLVLTPVKAGDENKLVADNIDENIIKEVLDDFFQLAGLSITPAKE
jgi:hypothetical protein